MHTPRQQMKTQFSIQCCQDCVPPKRHPACWGHCPDYKKERAEYDERKAEADKAKKVKNGIYCQRADSVTKAIKKHGR